jgi:hypothetical protein
MQRFRLSYTTDPDPTTTSGANWTVIDPTFVDTSRADTSIMELAGNIMEISGSAIPDHISIVAEGVDTNGITGFRLEALLGLNGLVGFNTGAGGNGNIVLSEFQVFATAIPEPASIAVWSVLGVAGLGFAVYRRRKRKSPLAA